jgi:hypothetical protein
LFSLGALLLISSSIWSPTYRLSNAIFERASGNNGDRMPSGYPALEGYPCTYKEKVEAGWGVFLLDAIGGIIYSWIP